MRTLLVLIAIAIIVLVFRRLMSPARPDRRADKTPAHMVQCAQCGTYVPEQEALTHEGRFYCSPAHIDKDKT